jgi:hypothetical protein
MGWADAFEQLNRTVASRAELKALGATGAGLTAAVRGSHLIRLRRDHYALPGVDQHVACAVRVGGRLGCLSALAAAGVFVFEAPFTHIWLAPLTSRPRSPRNRFVPLRATDRDGAELHWVELMHPPQNEIAIDIRDALLQSLRCQPKWASVATFDSALHQGLVTAGDVARIFDTAPARFRWVRERLDGRAESGPESALRLIVRGAGLACELQVYIPTVGRVDMVVEGCLVLEADSRVGHAGWEKQLGDRTRDILLAGLEMMSLRPTSEHIFNRSADLRAGILGLLATNRRFRP